jgi:seryl-tRNA synthetase
LWDILKFKFITKCSQNLKTKIHKKLKYMLDIKWVKENTKVVQDACTNKGINIDVNEVLKFEKNFKDILFKVEELRKERNAIADANKGKKPSDEDIAKGKKVKEDLVLLESELAVAESAFINEFKKIPNIPTSDTPVGLSEDENKEVKVGGVKKVFNFPIKNHWQIGEAKGWIDKERAAKVSGARFAYLKGDLVQLEWAVMRWIMDELGNEEVIKKLIQDNNLKILSKPFVPVLPPYMIRTAPYDAMDRLEPRDERYKIEGEDLWLQGSAEHVLGSMYIDEIFQEKDLPVRYLGFATSFRKEAGSAGKDMEGIIRMHQFNKLEMESFTTKETSLDEHFLMVAIQEYILQRLELPYRVLLKCTYDIGKPNARGVDMDVWFPSQNKYRETHTADYMTDYQARRLNTRVRREDGTLELIHTNDATALSQRPVIAILENNQQENGDVAIPEVLQKYMNGKKFI